MTTKYPQKVPERSDTWIQPPVGKTPSRLTYYMSLGDACQGSLRIDFLKVVCYNINVSFAGRRAKK
jgi:hypothetical protein